MIHIQIATVPATCISWSHRIARFPSKFELCFHYSYADLDYSSVHGFVVLRIIQAATSQLFWMIINDKHMCFSSFLLLFLSSLLRIILFVILSGEHSSRGDVVGLLPFTVHCIRLMALQRETWVNLNDSQFAGFSLTVMLVVTKTSTISSRFPIVESSHEEGAALGVLCMLLVVLVPYSFLGFLSQHRPVRTGAT